MRTRIWTVTAMPLFSNRPGMERMMQQKLLVGKSRKPRLSRRSIPAMAAAMAGSARASDLL